MLQTTFNAKHTQAADIREQAFILIFSPQDDQRELRTFYVNNRWLRRPGPWPGAEAVTFLQICHSAHGFFELYSRYYLDRDIIPEVTILKFYSSYY